MKGAFKCYVNNIVMQWGGGGFPEKEHFIRLDWSCVYNDTYSQIDWNVN